MVGYKWQFAPRFRYHAFGWKSDKPIQRIKEALAEIKLVSKSDPVLAAEGAVLFLEKLSPALEHVDSSSGSLGSTVNRAIETLVPIIAIPNVEQLSRDKWLERLWTAIQDDQIPYIELLGDYWGELCVNAMTASRWADEFMPVLSTMWARDRAGHGYFKGTSACFSALYAAGRYEALLTLLEKAPFTWWWYRRWGVKALVAMGKKAEAIRYAEDSKGINDPVSEIAQVCEAILLSAGMSEAAYDRYAFDANLKATPLATFKAIAKKYPHKTAKDILHDLAKRQPGSEGKWFAAAKDAELFDLALDLAKLSPPDIRTMIRATRDYAEKRPDFAISTGLIALQWLVKGHGYQITATEIREVYTELLRTANHAGIAGTEIKAQIQQIVNTLGSSNSLVHSVLKPYLEFIWK